MPLSDLQTAIEAWVRTDLSSVRLTLDKQGLEIADNQERCAEGREALKEVIRDFKNVRPDERPARVCLFQGCPRSWFFF